MNRKQNGFGIVEIIIIVAMAAGLAALGWYLWQGQQQPVEQTTQVTRDYSDPCSLFVKSEVEGAFGVPFGNFKKEDIKDVPNISICKISQTRESAGNGVGEGVSLVVKIQSYKTLGAVQTEIELTRALADYGELPEYVLTEVEGLGDEAFFYQHRGIADQVMLYVRKGTTIFELTALRLGGLDDSAAKGQLRQLAGEAF